MRGIVFTELLEFIEAHLGFDMVDSVLEHAGLANDGVFTQGGNYPFDELLKLVTTLSEQTGKPVNDLLTNFGEHLLVRLIGMYGEHMHPYQSTITLVSEVEGIIHAEVRKLYPDAELPTFKTIEKTETRIVLHYISDKRLEALAYGLMLGASKHFNENILIAYAPLDSDSDTIVFTLEKQDG